MIRFKAAIAILVSFVCINGWALANDKKGTYVVTTTVGKVTTHAITFHEGVNTQSATLIRETLHMAKEGDKVTIDIRSPGGRLSEMVVILRAMRETKAEVSCNVNRQAASAAAIIAWNCPTLTASKKSYVLFHKVALPGSMFLFHSTRLTSNELDRISAELKSMDQAIFVLYLSNAMTEKEQTGYHEGYDMVVPAKEVVRRHLNQV